MQQINPKITASQPHRFYGPGTKEGKLEDEIISHSAGFIGRNDAWKDRINKRGIERQGMLDMSISCRVYRTVDIHKFSRDEIEKIHKYEIDFMDRFLCLGEMKNVTKNFDIKDQFFLTENQIKNLIDFNNSHRPIIDREIFGYRIPPYYSYDQEFDGMKYHHAWDLCVYNSFTYEDPVNLKDKRSNKKSEDFI